MLAERRDRDRSHGPDVPGPSTPELDDAPLASAEEARPDTIQFHYDAFLDGNIEGWVWDSAAPNQAVSVELRLGGEPILIRHADLYRQDLQAEGMNGGRCGFLIDVPARMLDRARSTQEVLTVNPVLRPDLVICRVAVCERLSPDGPTRAMLRMQLAQAGEATSRFGLVHDDPPGPATAIPAYRALLERSRADGTGAETIPDLRLSPFAEFVRSCHQLEDRFSPDVVRADFDHFYRWYIDAYGASRKPLRAPLDAATIRYLNETITLGGLPYSITRVMLWYLMDGVHGALRSGPAEEVGYGHLLYWWASTHTPRLGVEDCLVTTLQADFLKSIPAHWAREPFPLSQFMLVALEKRFGHVAIGSVYDVQTRLTAYILVLIQAIDEPGILRFVPNRVLDRFFGDGGALFDRLVGELSGETPGVTRIDARIFREALHQRGFDLSTRRFLSVDKQGHRSEAARLAVPKDVTHDVQVIGPFSKVSGIARASQISRQVLSRTDLDCVFVDFTLDNNQPDAAGAAGSSRCAHARVNLIHLNADMLPNAVAYLPDVFSDAYNIGYFFWELNEPAACHRLALELVDEIWVSSEYNRRCFAARTDKPVVNVGMAITGVDHHDRSAARSRLNQRLGIDSKQFVFVSTFDSLSYLQRKNPLGALRAFRDAFPDDDGTCFVLKTHNAGSLTGTSGAKYWDDVLRYGDEDNRIKIVNETISFESLMDLKAASDCYVSLHRSEGFGFGLVEAMSLDVPVLCTAYSGNMDFCNEETAWLVEWDEVAVSQNDYAHVTVGHRWAEPRHASAVAAMRAVRRDGLACEKKAVAARRFVGQRYSLEATVERYRHRLQAILNGNVRTEASA